MLLGCHEVLLEWSGCVRAHGCGGAFCHCLTVLACCQVPDGCWDGAAWGGGGAWGLGGGPDSLPQVLRRCLRGGTVGPAVLTCCRSRHGAVARRRWALTEGLGGWVTALSRCPRLLCRCLRGAPDLLRPTTAGACVQALQRWGMGRGAWGTWSPVSRPVGACGCLRACRCSGRAEWGRSGAAWGLGAMPLTRHCPHLLCRCPYADAVAGRCGVKGQRGMGGERLPCLVSLLTTPIWRSGVCMVSLSRCPSIRGR